MSNLGDLIRIAIERGDISEPFRTGEVRAFIERHQGILDVKVQPEYVASYLANHSTGPGTRVGESVRRGQKRLFIKHEGPATYSLDYSIAGFETQEEPASTEQRVLDEVGEHPKRPSSKRIKGGKSGFAGGKNKARDNIAETFVDYLRNKPYRFLKTRKSGTVKSKLEWRNNVVTGWNNRLNEYEWEKVGWAETNVTLQSFSQRLSDLESSWQRGENVDALAENIYRDIRKWGNPRGAQYSGRQVVAFLVPLWQGDNVQSVDSTLTKLYALARPDAYAMYDSRVAASIMTIAEDIFRPKMSKNKVVHTVVDAFRHHYPRLGLYGGTGGTRQRGYRAGSGWPVAYRSVPAQLEANDLCLRIQAKLNSEEGEDGRNNWTLREVEAVLFMEGY